MPAFAAALDDLFADPNIASTALWRAGGSGPAVAVRVISRRPDRIAEFGEVGVHTASAVFEVRVSEVPAPAEGDTITLDGETFVVQGEPVRDAERLVWSIDTRPA